MATNDEILIQLKSINTTLVNIDGFGRASLFMLVFLTATIFFYTLSSNLLQSLIGTGNAISYLDYEIYAFVSLILSFFLARFIISWTVQGINKSNPLSIQKEKKRTADIKLTKHSTKVTTDSEPFGYFKSIVGGLISGILVAMIIQKPPIWLLAIYTAILIIFGILAIVIEKWFLDKISKN